MTINEINFPAIVNPTLYITPVEPARQIARKALDRRRDLPKSKRGGLDPLQAAEEGVGSGVLRARDIAGGKRIDAYRVKSFFDRHRGNYLKAKASKLRWEDSKAIQAWDLWGGEPLRKQVNAVVARDKANRQRPNPSSSMSLGQAQKIVSSARKINFQAPAIGGLADGRGAREFDSKSLAQGILVELEHADDPLLAMRIGMDHLVEDPEYYQKLRAVEGVVGPYRLIRTKPNPHPFHTRHHNWDEVLIDHDGRRLTRGQILAYYKKNENNIWPFLQGQTVMVILATKQNEFVRRRHGSRGSFIKLTKLKGIDDPKSFEYWIHRRAIEFHPTLTSKRTPILWLDLDMHSTKSPETRKKLLTTMKASAPNLKRIFNEFGVEKVHMYDSGSAGIHLEGNLEKPKSVDALRKSFTRRLSESFEDDHTFTTGIAAPGQIRLDTTTLHRLGSLRAPYSMTVYGVPKLPIRRI